MSLTEASERLLRDFDKTPDAIDVSELSARLWLIEREAAARPSGEVDLTTAPLIWNDGYAAAIRDMENEGVITWRDEGHRARFITALDGRREEGT